MRVLSSIGLQTKIIVFVMLGLSVSFGLLSVIGLEAADESTQRTLDERLIIARMAANHIDQMLKHGLDELEKRARPGIIDLGERNRDEEARVLKEIFRESAVFTYNAFLLDSRGFVLLTEPNDPILVGTNLSTLPHIAKTLETGQSSISGVVAAPGSRKPIVSLSVAIRNREGKITGVLGGAFDLTHPTISEVIQGMRPGLTGHTQIVDERGIVVASTDPDYILREWRHTGLVPPGGSHEVFVVSDPYFRDGRLLQNDVVAYVGLRTTSWGVAVEQNEEEAFAPAKVLRNRIMLFAAVSFASGLLFAWIIARSVTRPIKLLTTASQRVAANDLTATVPVRGRDELGVLAAAFDTMTARLRESRAEIERWNKDLETRVVERTRELSCLYEVSNLLSSTHDIDSLCENVVAAIVPFFDQADTALLYLYDAKLDALVARPGFDGEPTAGYPAKLQVDEGVPGRVFQTGEPVVCDREICVPVVYKHKMLGCLILASSRQGHLYNGAQLKLLQALADRIAVAIENARLGKQAEQARALQEADRLKSEFISTISHELRTPLASIKGYATTLLRKDVTWDEATRAEFLQIIDEESDKLRELIDNLLEMSKVEAGVLKIYKQPVLLARIASRAIAEQQTRAKEH